MILSLEVVNFSRPFLVNFQTPVDNREKINRMIGIDFRGSLQDFDIVMKCVIYETVF